MHAGRLGTKSGAGFYDGDPTEATADAAGHEVAARSYASALDEARRCVEEEIAAPGDVDVAMRYGCGWGAGPLEWSENDRGGPRDPTGEARPGNRTGREA